MKKYSICFFAIYCVCFILLYLIYPDTEEENMAIAEESETILMQELAEAGAVVVEQPMTEGTEVINREVPVAPTYLVCSGTTEILVYYPDYDSVYKRIPIVPEDLSEEDKLELSKGIRFETLEELYHYLESITS